MLLLQMLNATLPLNRSADPVERLQRKLRALVEEMPTHQDGIGGGPTMQRLKSSTHLNNINLLKNQTLKSQGP
jgi:hypothetical protein